MGEQIEQTRLTDNSAGWRLVVALLGLYALTIVVYFVIPAGDAFDRLLIGSAVYNHDAVLNAGILEWGYRSLWSSSLHFFDWPAAFPLKNGLAGTENLAGWQLFYSPMRAAGANVASSYNVTILLSLVVAGLSCTALSRRLGASRAGAIMAGFAFAFNPFHIDHTIHIQTMAICWSPLALLGLDIALERRSPGGVAMLGIGFVMSFFCGMYFGVFLSMILALYVVIAFAVGRYRPSARALIDIAGILIAGLVVLSPIFIHYFRFAASFGAYPHSKAELSMASLPLEALARTPIWLTTWSATVFSTSEPGRFVAVFPGIITLSLALFGVAKPVTDEKARKAVPILLILGATCFLLALGPVVETRPGVASAWLTALPLPGKIWVAFSAIRWPMRIFMYSTLCLALLTGTGATSLLSRVSFKWSSAVTAALFVLLFFELRPAAWFTSGAVRVVDPMKMSDAYPFLAAENDRGGVVEFPSKMDSGLTTAFSTRYAYGASGHFRGVIAFHGSLFPPLLDSLRTAAEDLPSDSSIRMITANGVTRLVVHKNLLSADSANHVVQSFSRAGDSILFDSPGSTVLALKKR